MPSAPTRLPTQRWLTVLLVSYISLAIYGSLYPFAEWRPATTSLLAAFARSLNGDASRADMVVNLLVYMPLGLMLMVRWRARQPVFVALGTATLLGFVLSLAMETLQLYLPSRTTSVIDLALNTVGTTLGAALPLLLSERSGFGRRLHEIRLRWIESGPLASFGLIVLGIWALSQLTPLVPSLDMGTLREGLGPLYHTVIDPGLFELGKALSYALSLFAVMLLTVTLLRHDFQHARLVAGLFVVSVLLAKVPIVARSLSAEAVAGAIAAIAGLWALSGVDRRQLLAVTAMCLVAAYATEQLRPTAGAVTGDLQWRLFSMQMLNIHGLQDVLAGIWPFAGLAYVAMRGGLPGRSSIIAGGAVFVAAAASALEWAQSAIPGRFPDLTDVVLATVGWTLPWLNPALRAPFSHDKPHEFP